MTDETQVAPEATQEVVQSEAEQVAAPEAAESTEGQEQTPPAEVDAETQETEDPSPSKQRRERRKAYQEQLRADKMAAENEAEQLRKRLAQYEAPEQQTTPPREADFEDYNQFLMAMASHQAGQQFDARQKAEIQREADAKQAEIDQLQARQQQEARENWGAQVTEAKTRYADFDAVAFAPDVPITEPMARILAASDLGADVAYHLGMNKALAAQIASAPLVEQALAIGRLEASISAPQPRTQTQAPEPVSPVKAKATASKSPEKMSMAEYVAARKAGKL